MLITAIHESSPGRVKVSLEDGSEIKSTLNTVVDLRLCSGEELDDKRLEEFRKASAKALGREKALEYISRRPMSCCELRKKLIDKGEDEEVADYCVSWLEENHFIDDAEYAAALARHCASKGYGPGRLRGELAKRGISRELWDDALEAMPSCDDKIDRFIASRLSDPEDSDQIRKICNALYRRGHSWEDIRKALARYEEELEEEY
ncbi:MAG: regulatory protein RecX [Candidatus Limivicinus sp.]|jgi:regulatory protein